MGGWDQTACPGSWLGTCGHPTPSEGLGLQTRPRQPPPPPPHRCPYREALQKEGKEKANRYVQEARAEREQRGRLNALHQHLEDLYQAQVYIMEGVERGAAVAPSA